MVSGKKFRESIHRPMPGARVKVRVVPAFTIQALQKNVIVADPPRSNFRVRNQRAAPTNFKKFYIRGDFPISVDFDVTSNKIAWKVELDKLDYHHYLPMFFDGLRETAHPYKFFARQGIKDLVEHCPAKVLPVIPQLVVPIKKALNTHNSEIICSTLLVLQDLVKAHDAVGMALVPYYRQILPVLNVYKDRNVNCGDDIDYSQRQNGNVGDLVQQTLEVLEQHGGEDAFINIKYMVPTYESVVLN